MGMSRARLLRDAAEAAELVLLPRHGNSAS